jgi:hypothetical protein
MHRNVSPNGEQRKVAGMSCSCPPRLTRSLLVRCVGVAGGKRDRSDFGYREVPATYGDHISGVPAQGGPGPL